MFDIKQYGLRNEFAHAANLAWLAGSKLLADLANRIHIDQRNISNVVKDPDLAQMIWKSIENCKKSVFDEFVPGELDQTTGSWSFSKLVAKADVAAELKNEKMALDLEEKEKELQLEKERKIAEGKEMKELAEELRKVKEENKKNLTKLALEKEKMKAVRISAAFKKCEIKKKKAEQMLVEYKLCKIFGKQVEEDSGIEEVEQNGVVVEQIEDEDNGFGADWSSKSS